ncbi:radical SAM protein [Bengtsoniella intestinalis]|uniref:radical SAM protein n=1 Tax=Bengtsoniella intestinalis TaxID=3073143 RepID=UPI00391F9FAB
MNKYNKDFALDYYKDYKSFQLTPSMVGDDYDLVVGSIDVSLTTRCNLKCANCGSLMPHYTCPKDVELDLIIQSLERFFAVVDRVARVNVIGGEPFMYPHLAEVVEYLNSKDQVSRVVFPTNGTVVPLNAAVYQALRNPKNEVRISHYEAYDKKSGQLLKKLEAEGVKHSVKQFGANAYEWYDFGGFENRGRDEETLATQYDCCAVEWFSMYRGRLYPCPRTAHAIDLGFIPAEGNYVDLADPSVPLETLKAQLQDFVYNNKYYPCCNHCDRGTGKCPVVAVAEQVK